MLELLRNALVCSPAPSAPAGADRPVDVVVGGGEILWIGADAKLAGSSPARVRDLRGRRVIPGLIEGHAHVTGGGGEAGFSTRVPPVMASRFTRFGVTSVIGLLGTDDCVRSIEELVATTYGLRETGLDAWCYTGGYHLPPRTLTGSVRKDIALIDPIVGLGELALSDHRSSQPTLDELLRVASEAHVAGLMSGKAGIVHLHLGDGERGLELVERALDQSELPPRVFQPTHVNRDKRLFDQACELTRRGCTIDVTAYPHAEGDAGWSAVDALALYLERGLDPTRITVSSDSGGCLPRFDRDGRVTHMDVGDPGELWRALKQLLGRGLALERVLPAFTSNVAALTRLLGRGGLVAGARADLVVLDENDEVSDVMCHGRWHVLDGKVRVRAPLEPRSEA